MNTRQIHSNNRYVPRFQRMKTSQWSRRRVPRGARPRGGSAGDVDTRQESSSIVEAFVQSPLVFLLGAFTGIMALDTQQDPLKSWIDDRARERLLEERT